MATVAIVVAVERAPESIGAVVERTLGQSWEMLDAAAGRY